MKLLSVIYELFSFDYDCLQGHENDDTQEIAREVCLVSDEGKFYISWVWDQDDHSYCIGYKQERWFVEPEVIIDASEWQIWAPHINREFSLSFIAPHHSILELKSSAGSIYFTAQEQGIYDQDNLCISTRHPEWPFKPPRALLTSPNEKWRISKFVRDLFKDKKPTLKNIIKQPNKPTTNKQKHQQEPFPLGVACNQSVSGVIDMYLYPQRLIDISNLLETFDTYVVFDVDHSLSALHNRYKVLDLAQLAAIKAINCVVIDANTLRLSASEFTRLLSILPHQHLCAFNITKDTNEENIIRNVLSYDEFSCGNTSSLLPQLVNSTFFLDSYFDCNLHLEAYDKNLLQQIFRRTMQIYVGTVLSKGKDTSTIEFGEIPAELTKALWPNNSGLVVLNEETEISESKISIGISKLAFNIRQTQDYSTDIIVTYNPTTQNWHLS